MTIFFARVDGQPVSLDNFLNTNIFARVNRQQMSFVIFNFLLTGSIRNLASFCGKIDKSEDALNYTYTRGI